VSHHDERDDYDDEPWRRLVAPDQLRRIANGLFIFGALQALAAICGSTAMAFSTVSAWTNGDIGKYRPPESYWMFAYCIVGGVTSAIVLRGASLMRRCLAYRYCLFAAVVALFPIPCYCLIFFNLALGISALRQLRRPDVRARFEAVARGTIVRGPAETPDARTD
jgi:hypothetical protein